MNNREHPQHADTNQRALYMSSRNWDIYNAIRFLYLYTSGFGSIDEPCHRRPPQWYQTDSSPTPDGSTARRMTWTNDHNQDIHNFEVGAFVCAVLSLASCQKQQHVTERSTWIDFSTSTIRKLFGLVKYSPQVIQRLCTTTSWNSSWLLVLSWMSQVKQKWCAETKWSSSWRPDVKSGLAMHNPQKLWALDRRMCTFLAATVLNAW